MAPVQERRLPHEAWHIVQRTPVEDGGNYKDDKYPDVKLEKLKTGVYKVLNDGAYKDRVIVFDVDEQAYYDKDPEGDFANYDNPFDISQVSSGPLAAVEVQTRYDNIGEAGKGVANVITETTLRTTGLNTCVGWLLYNDTAAYLTHIVVDNPGKVKADSGIRNQVQAIVSQFTEITGAPPTHLKIHVGCRATFVSEALCMAVGLDAGAYAFFMHSELNAWTRCAVPRRSCHRREQEGVERNSHCFEL